MLRLLRKHFSSSSSSSPSSTKTSPDPSSSLTLYFLRNSCGLSPETALSISQRLHLKSTKKPHAVLSLLKSYHFSPPHITKVISRRPKLLLSDADRTLKPKLDFLHSAGFSGPALIALVTSVPALLQFSLQNRLARNFNHLKRLLGTDESVVSAVKSSAWLLASNFEKVLLPEMKELEDYGVPMNVRLMMLAKHAKSLVDRDYRFRDIFDLVKTAGINPTSPLFAHAFGVLAKLPKRSWEKKVENFKRLGWSEEQVTSAFARHPYCMSVSCKKL